MLGVWIVICVSSNLQPNQYADYAILAAIVVGFCKIMQNYIKLILWLVEENNSMFFSTLKVFLLTFLLQILVYHCSDDNVINFVFFSRLSGISWRKRSTWAKWPEWWWNANESCLVYQVGRFSLLQVNKFGGPSDQSAFMMPFMRPFFYHENSYMPLDEPTLKEYVRNQMWVLSSFLSISLFWPDIIFT
jgi:hypothetical protein